MLLRVVMLNFNIIKFISIFLYNSGFFVLKKPSLNKTFIFSSKHFKVVLLAFQSGLVFSFSPMENSKCKGGPRSTSCSINLKKRLFIVWRDDIACEKPQGWTSTLWALLRMGCFCCELLVYPQHLHQNLYIVGRW